MVAAGRSGARVAIPHAVVSVRMTSVDTGGLRIAHGAHTAQLVCHMGVLSGNHPRNSLAAVAECIEAGAGRIELDIHSLDGPDYIVYHDRRLESETQGSGSVGRATPDGVRALSPDPEGRPPLLSEIVDLVRGSGTELQLDWKDWRLISDARLQALVDVIAPVREQVIVSTGQDWNLRRLHALAPDVAFGFDPGLYIDHAIEGSVIFLPRTMGAYGYRDDHPLAFGRAEPVTEYLAARMAILCAQTPGGREYFLSYRMVLQMLDDGFDVVAWLHERGLGANVWTLDQHGPSSVIATERLLDAGIDRVTTNTAPAWQRALSA
jgi:glycerophosphoryl diester phosphodiesterase